MLNITYFYLLIVLFLCYIKNSYGKDVIFKFDEYIRKVGVSSEFEEDDIVKIVSFEKSHIDNVKIQDLNEPPEFYDTFVIHSGVNFNPKYYFESGTFQYLIYDKSSDKNCIKQATKEGMHYGAVAIMNYRSSFLGDAIQCIGTFLHAKYNFI